MRTFHVVVRDAGSGVRQVDIEEDPTDESSDLDQLEKYIREVSVYTPREKERLLRIIDAKRWKEHQAGA